MIHVLDTSAALAYFLDEPGGEIIDRMLISSNRPCCVHSVNWVEIFYKMRGKKGEKAAETTMENLRLLKVSVIDVPGEDFLRRVANIKSKYLFLALGDCSGLTHEIFL